MKARWEPEPPAPPGRRQAVVSRAKESVAYWRDQLDGVLRPAYQRRMPTIELVVSAGQGAGIHWDIERGHVSLKIDPDPLYAHPRQYVQQVLPYLVATIAANVLHGQVSGYADARLQVILTYMGKFPLPIFTPPAAPPDDPAPG